MTEDHDDPEARGVSPLTLFHRTMAALCRAELPLGRALRVVREDLRDRRLAAAIEAIALEVEAGTPLAQAYARQAAVFPPTYAAVLEAGIASGDLAGAFEDLAHHAELRVSLSARLRTALTYPLTGITLSLVIAAFLLYVITPPFYAVFDSLNVQLPALTRLVLELGQLEEVGVALVLVATGSLLLAAWIWVRDPLLERGLVGRLCGWLPGIAGLRRSAARTAALATLGVLIRRELPLDRALSLAAASAGGGRLGDGLRRAASSVAAGGQLGDACETTGLLDDGCLWLLRAGENKGLLGPVLRDVVELYRGRVRRAAERAASLLVPGIIATTGVVVGVVVLSVFAPMFNLIGLLS